MEIKSVRCSEISEHIDSVTLDTYELPEPGPSEVCIAIKACAVNFPDLLMIQGKYQFKPPLPFAPGGEFAGDILAIGSEVSAFKPGDRVMCSSRYGGFADAINVEAETVVEAGQEVIFDFSLTVSL